MCRCNTHIYVYVHVCIVAHSHYKTAVRSGTRSSFKETIIILALLFSQESNVFYILREAAGFNGRHRQLRSALSHSGS